MLISFFKLRFLKISFFEYGGEDFSRPTHPLYLKSFVGFVFIEPHKMTYQIAVKTTQTFEKYKGHFVGKGPNIIPAKWHYPTILQISSPPHFINFMAGHLEMVSMATAGGQENSKLFLHAKFISKLLAKTNWGNLFDFTENCPKGAVSP